VTSAATARTTGIRAGQGLRTGGAQAGHTMVDGGERFAAYAAHELRTPLATQRALLELALSDPNADVAGWREVGEDVLRACGHQERLLEACLTLAWSRGKPPQCEPVDLAAIAGEALRAQGPNGHESVLALEPAWTSGDPDLLEQLAANLVSNAIRHNVAAGRIELTTRVEPGHAVLSVANTGPIVPAAELRRLFQPFQRLDPNPRTAGDGAGLGLAIVDAIAAAHGALVTARTRSAGGLEIDVSFPGTLERGAPEAVEALRSRACPVAAPRPAVGSSSIGVSRPATRGATGGAA
jgi:signal transduction histidine kinase